MLSRIMNYLLSGTDLPERFQIPVLYRNSFALSIGILHKFRPSFFTWSAMKNLPDLQYPPHSFLPHAPRKQQKAAAHAHNTCSAAILSYYICDISRAHDRILSLLRSSRYQSAERQKRQNVRDDHKSVEEVRQGPYKLQLQAGTDHDADNNDQGVEL